MRTSAFVVFALLLTTKGFAQPAQTFKAATELVAVEVTVLDGNGNPAPGLTAADFAVSVAGKERPIRSLQFIRTDPTAVAPVAADVSNNQLPTSGRALLIAVDESGLRPGAALGLVRSAKALLTHLSPGDVVGLARIPGGGGVAFTTDRARIAEGLERVTGGPPRVKTTNLAVSLSEAVDYGQFGKSQWLAALQRECPLPGTRGYEACVSEMSMEAAALLRFEDQKRSNQAGALRNLISVAAATGAPVTIVLISSGFYVGNDHAVFAELAEAAAAAQVSLHVVRPIGSEYDLTSGGISSDRATDEQLRREGLEQFAARLDGRLYETTAGATPALFDRIGRELAGYYLLGIEPTDEDRKLRRLRLTVKVKRPGLTSRARSMFTLQPATGTTPLDPAEQLRQMLKAPIAKRGLPIALTTRVVDGGDDKHVRLLVSAEIGEQAVPDARYHVAMLVLDRLGEVVTSNAATVPLQPAHTRFAAAALFTTSVVVERGDYSIRVAAIDTDGRAGSVHHEATARFHEWTGGFASSDFIVATAPPPDEFPTVNASAIVEGSQVAAVLELTNKNAAALEAVDVRFAVGGIPLEAAASRTSRAADSSGLRRFAAVASLDLPPGAYTVDVIVTPRDGKPVKLTSAIHYYPAPMPIADAITIDVVRGHIEALERRLPVSELLADFVLRAKDGEFVIAPDAGVRPPGDLAMVTFVGAVAALRDHKPALARALLTQTLKTAPGFEAAVFYLSLIS